MFDGCEVENIITTSSDHHALLIKLRKGVNGGWKIHFNNPSGSKQHG
jgi:hypothetical protein